MQNEKVVPSIGQVLRCYRAIAAAERMKTGRPGENTVANAIRGTRCVCRAAGVSLEAPVSRLTRRTLDTALAEFVRQGLARLSAWSYLCQLRSVFARWCQPYYRDAGWTVPPLELPVFRARSPRYVRPSREQLVRVKNWYRRQRGERWFAATMMLEFAMRNGDVMRLRPENFIERRDQGLGIRDQRLGMTRHYLCYVPHKTALSSGRRVCWPIHEDIWRQIDACGGPGGFDITDETFAGINRDLRHLGFSGSKASYELRKICIDHVYQKFGAEKAVSISGDDIRTISHYYADPAQPNIGAVRVLDLIG